MAYADDLLKQIWQSLSDAATLPGNNFTLMNVSTVGLDGGPKARFVILRDFARAPERLGFATHNRSAKVAEIRANPAMAATFYDRERSVQLRLEGTAHIIDSDAERWRAWQKLAPHSQLQYDSMAVPGDPFDASTNQQDDPSTAFQRFAWIKFTLQRLDWLVLTSEPNHRWRFDRTTSGWNGQRLVA